MTATITNELDCYPKYLLHNYREHPDWIAVRRKDFGIWNNYTWKEAYEIVREVAMGLLSLGLNRDDRAVVIGDEEPEGFWAIMAIQCAGGVPVPLYSAAQRYAVQARFSGLDAVVFHSTGVSYASEASGLALPL